MEQATLTQQILGEAYRAMLAGGPEAWCRSTSACDITGTPVQYDSPAAVRWCASARIMAVKGHPGLPALKFANEVAARRGMPGLMSTNDRPEQDGGGFASALACLEEAWQESLASPGSP